MMTGNAGARNLGMDRKSLEMGLNHSKLFKHEQNSTKP